MNSKYSTAKCCSPSRTYWFSRTIRSPVACTVMIRSSAVREKVDVARGDAVELDPLVAAVVEDGVGAVAAAEDIVVVAAEALEPVVAGAAVDGIADALEAVDRVVAGGLGDVDIMLEQLEVGPVGAVAELDRLQSG